MQKNVGLILAPFIIELISFVDFNRTFYPLALAESSASNVIPTYADHIMYIYGGMAQYIPNPAELVSISCKVDDLAHIPAVFHVKLCLQRHANIWHSDSNTQRKSPPVVAIKNLVVLFRNTPFSYSPLGDSVHCLPSDEGGSFSCFTCRHNLASFFFQTFSTGTAIGQIQISLLCFAVACCCFIFLVSMPDDPFSVY